MRFMRMFIIVFSIVFLNMLNAQTLKTMSQSGAAPKFIKDSNLKGEINVTGLCMDYIHAIEEEDPSIKFTGYEVFAPFARKLAELEHNKIDCIVGIVKNDVRAKKYKFIDIPIYTTNHVVAINKDDNIEISSFDDIRNLGNDGKILTNFGAAHVKFLKDQGGLIIDETADNTPQNLLKLTHRRARFMYLNDIELAYDIKNEKMQDKVVLLPHSFAKFPHYIAFSPATPDEVVDKVAAILKKFKNSGKLDKIYQKYISN